MLHKELKVLCDLLMVSDPWPLNPRDQEILENFADDQAIQAGYTNWVDFYHDAP